MSSDQVQRVKEASDIVSLIQERLSLKPAGRNYRGLCPFHSEKSPSFFVSAEMQLFKCFGCGKSGDVFTFLQEYEGLTFPEALEQLATKAGITLEQNYKTTDDQRRERSLAILHLAAEFYHYLLTQHAVGEVARHYMKGRGIHQRSVADFKLGYAPQSWDTLKTYLVGKKGYQDAEIEAVGLSVKSQGQRYYDRFRGRLMFPLLNTAGQIVGFSGRVLDSKAKEAKYINTPETALYHKSRLLFGYHQAKQAIRQKDRVIVVEGELDVISSHQIGVKEAVAVKGSALTVDQVRLVKRLTSNVILALDADAAGQEAIRRAIDIAENLQVNPRIIVVPSGKDPDELAQKQPEVWKQASKQSISLYQFYIDLAFSRFDGQSAEGQKQISQMVIPILAKITNSVEQSFYLKRLAERLQTSEQVVLAELARVTKVTTLKTEQPLPAPSHTRISRYERLQQEALAVVLQFEAQASQKLEKLDPAWFVMPQYQRLVEQLQRLNQRQPARSTLALVKKLPAEQQSLVQELYSLDQHLLEDSHETLVKRFEKILVALQQEAVKQRLVSLSQQLQTTTDPQELETLQQRFRQASSSLHRNTA